MGNQRGMHMLSSLKRKQLSRLFFWMNPNFMVASWRSSISCSLKTLHSFCFMSAYFLSCWRILFDIVFRYQPRGPMFLAWSNSALGAPIPIWATDLGRHLWLLHIYILLMDMGMDHSLCIFGGSMETTWNYNLWGGTPFPFFLIFLCMANIFYNSLVTECVLYPFCRKVPRFRVPMRYSPYFWSSDSQNLILLEYVVGICMPFSLSFYVMWSAAISICKENEAFRVITLLLCL